MRVKLLIQRAFGFVMTAVLAGCGSAPASPSLEPTPTSVDVSSPTQQLSISPTAAIGTTASTLPIPPTALATSTTVATIAVRPTAVQAIPTDLRDLVECPG